ncbi:large ribosomal subunit protein eL28y-like [Magnolia sinica]|uniref:large ribosomal subunit protein eL28y-like n=1 Tax=Magnolia sinica TaxID=86752 RepID=UPI00265810AA|nr:large ribosomal subunit protein eL28y-like [Magnolia sinica]
MVLLMFSLNAKLKGTNGTTKESSKNINIASIVCLCGIAGLANKKTVLIQPAGKDLSIVLATTKTKNQNHPANMYHRSVMKKEFRQMAKAVVNWTGDLWFDGRERIRHTRDWLLQLKEVVDVPEDILKIKQDIESELFGDD